MSIPFSRYVNIVSGVGAGSSVRQRDLILRLFTASPLVSPDSVLEFSNAADVATFFGATSEEATRAGLYFGYVSPAISRPRKLSFAAYVAGGNDATVIGNNDFKALSGFTASVAGQMSITLGGTTYNVTGVDLSEAASLAAVATAVQTAVRAANAALAGATVTYGSINPQRFILAVPGADATISVQSTGTGNNDLALLMGLTLAVGAINVTGSDPISAVGAVQRSEAITNNFGSIVFQPAITLQDVEAVAAYVHSVNVKYQFHARVSAADAQAWHDALQGYSGTGLTLAPLVGEYPELIPAAILAATDYNRRNSVQNYMFKQFAGVSSSVSDSTAANMYDALRVNYYGDTSTAGQTIMFYQRGTLMGTGTAPVDMNTFANEQWLKDAMGANIMTLLLSVGRVPANIAGRGMLLNVLQTGINAALFNGTISVGKALTAVQKAFITEQTGDALAWQTVQSAGYVVDVQFEQYTTVGGATEYKAVYTLIYAKDDAIRLVEGSHQLI